MNCSLLFGVLLPILICILLGYHEQMRKKSKIQMLELADFSAFGTPRNEDKQSSIAILDVEGPPIHLNRQNSLLTIMKTSTEHFKKTSKITLFVVV
jgi:hypothetical protein